MRNDHQNDRKGCSKTMLHSLEPIAPEPNSFESLISYLSRLAYSHAVSVAGLLGLILREGGLKESTPFIITGQGMSLLGDYARRLAAWTSALTGMPNLERLTLLDLAPLLSKIGLQSVYARWCPACYQRDAFSGVEPHDRLKWSVSNYHVCDVHGVAIVDQCPVCAKKFHPLTGASLPGWCSKCGSWLGGQGRNVEDERLIWESEQVLRLFDRRFDGDVHYEKRLFVRNLEKTIVHVADGNAAAFSRLVGLPKNTVNMWTRSNTNPSLPSLLAVCRALGVSLDNLMSTQFCPQAEVNPDLVRRVAIQRQKGASPRKINWRRVASQLDAFLLSEEVLTFKEVALRIGVDERSLRRRFPNQVADITGRWKNASRERAREKQASNVKLLRRIRDDLVRDGKTLTYRSLVQHLGEARTKQIEKCYSLISKINKESRKAS